MTLYITCLNIQHWFSRQTYLFDLVLVRYGCVNDIKLIEVANLLFTHVNLSCYIVAMYFAQWQQMHKQHRQCWKALLRGHLQLKGLASNEKIRNNDQIKQNKYKFYLFYKQNLYLYTNTKFWGVSIRFSLKNVPMNEGEQNVLTTWSFFCITTPFMCNHGSPLLSIVRSSNWCLSTITVRRRLYIYTHSFGKLPAVSLTSPNLSFSLCPRNFNLF